MSKRIASLLLVVVLAVSLLSVSVLAEDYEVQISAGTAEATTNEGTTIQVPVSIDVNPGLVVGRVKVTWDESALALTSVTFGEGLGQNNGSAKEGPEVEGEPTDGIINDGEYPVSFGSYTPNPNSDWTTTGELFVLNFEVQEGAQAGDYTIGLSGETSAFLNTNIQEKTVGCTAGQITLYNEIEEVNVKITAPVKGAAPEETVSGTGYTGVVTWSPVVDGTFAPATEYEASVVLTPAAGYKFAADVAAKINDVAVEETIVDGKLSASYEFEATAHNEVASAPLTVIAPVKGAEPQETVSGTGFTGTIAWNGNPDTFAANTEYTATVTLNAATGYKFADEFAATVNGANATIKAQEDFTVVLTYTFPKTEKNQIDNVTLEITAPVKGAAPQDTIEAGTGYTGTISWNGNPSKFAASTVYIATVVLNPGEDYEFAENVSVKVNGEDATSAEVVDGKLTVTYVFPATGSKEAQTITCADVTATYGDAVKALNATGAQTAVTYAVTEGAGVVSVDASGTLTFLKVGSAKVTITAAEDDDYLGATKVVNVTVSPADYTYAMTADTQFVKIGSGLSAITVAPASGSGVNGETVTGNLKWYTDEARSIEATDAALNALASGEKVTLYWSFTSASANYVAESKVGAVEFTAYMIGDVNLDGRVTDKDAMILARYCADWDGYEEKILCKDAANINGQGTINDADARIIARYLAGWAGYDSYFN